MSDLLDLSEVSEAALLKELSMRHETTLFAFVDSDLSDGTETNHVKWFGGVMVASGLAHWAREHIVAYMRDGSVEQGEES